MNKAKPIKRKKKERVTERLRRRDEEKNERKREKDIRGLRSQYCHVHIIKHQIYYPILHLHRCYAVDISPVMFSFTYLEIFHLLC